MLPVYAQRAMSQWVMMVLTMVFPTTPTPLRVSTHLLYGCANQLVVSGQA